MNVVAACAELLADLFEYGPYDVALQPKVVGMPIVAIVPVVVAAASSFPVIAVGQVVVVAAASFPVVTVGPVVLVVVASFPSGHPNSQ